MRKEPYSVGSFVHVYKRGTRKMPIVRDDADRWRFLKLIRYVNDQNLPRNWERDIGPDLIRQNYARPQSWGDQKPYVSILAYCLMDNHFHLLLQERVDGGISKFMQRVCTSMSAAYNAKYTETGTLFQGSFRARTVKDDEQLQYLAAYIHVKNAFERYPAGLKAAIREYNRAYEWAKRDPFVGLESDFPILDQDVIRDVLLDNGRFRAYARDVMYSRADIDDIDLLIDEA